MIFGQKDKTTTENQKTDETIPEEKKQEDLVFSLKQQLAKSEETIKDYVDHLKRLQAEFENYIKRVEKERTDFKKFSSEKIILKILLIIDDLERALKEFAKEQIPQEVMQGMQMIFKNMHKIIEEEGVKEIKATNQKFDPHKHEVLLVECNGKCEDNIVLEELQKGYMLGDKVIRYAKVKINKQKTNQGGN
ncbi:nucleotide exchange factor GrpE [Candidatus Woesearchaeota archaeon]|nr:nucleotide exchange factor GrpE [Candidatus Woesearchaeota archaeon]